MASVHRGTAPRAGVGGSSSIAQDAIAIVMCKGAGPRAMDRCTHFLFLCTRCRLLWWLAHLGMLLASKKINFSYYILLHLITSYSSYFGGKKGISGNKTSFFLLMLGMLQRQQWGQSGQWHDMETKN